MTTKLPCCAPFKKMVTDIMDLQDMPAAMRKMGWLKLAEYGVRYPAEFVDTETNTRTFFATALLCLSMAAFAGEPAKVQKPEQLEAELQSMVNGTTRIPYKELKNSGWKLPEFGGMGQPWPHDYLVVKKANVYGVIVTQGKKTEKISHFGVPYYDYKGGANTAYVPSGIPAEYLPVVGCEKITDWEDARRRCKASKGEDCSLNTPSIEMVAFVKMPSKCAQQSTLLHSAYRYSDDNPAQLQRTPIEGVNCVVEDHRAKQCPVLTQ